MATEIVPPDSRLTEGGVDRERLKAVMRSSRLLVEQDPTTRASPEIPTLTLDEAAEILSRGDGPSFSQQVADERR